jgi:radical SAM superfamily enzyme YgiQ (UPF0313 family)
VLVGFEDQDNLGIRYLSSYLRHHGHQTQIVTVRKGTDPIVQTIESLRPHIVGFSLIFQYFADDFAELMSQLCERGIEAHFTMGGHYASFEYEALLNAVPELDSVVRFEGEETLLELSRAIATGTNWRSVAGIAFRNGDRVELTAERTGRRDLNELAWPDRDDICYGSQKVPVASVLGSRGCPWKCSFCSIITFYDGNGTRGKRLREPKKIVDELEYLHRERGVQIVLWQDDDFLAPGSAGVRWTHAIAREAMCRGLHRNLRWKISCRSDEVNREALTPLVAAGLTHVYLGVEAGDEKDLKDMNKLLQPEVHLRAGQVLRDLGLSFDFGFMLLQPWSTLESARNNVRFLHKFAENGATVVGFCRMLPYVGTAVADRLAAEGRLRHDDLNADYNFLDPRLDGFYAWLLETFEERNFTTAGTVNLLRLLQFHSHLDLPEQPADPTFQDTVDRITAISNTIALDTIDAALDYFESSCPEEEFGSGFLDMLTRHQLEEDARVRLDAASVLVRHPEILEQLHISR